MQLDLFKSPPAPSSPLTLTAPSSALSPLIGLRVQLPRDCPNCGNNIAVIGSSCGPHSARLSCTECHRHAGWMGAREVAFVAKIVSAFGCPTTPIVVREWRHV